MHRLLDINDSIGMAVEIARSTAAAFCCQAVLVVLIALADKGIIPIDTRMHVCPLASTVLTLLDMHVLSRRYWGTHDNSKKSANHRAVAVTTSTYSAIERGTSFNALASTNGGKQILDPAKLNTSLKLLNSAPLKAAYEQYVEKALCYESYKFLVDATEYYTTEFSDPTEQVSVASKLCVA
jgi:hypothetical protein